MKKNIFEIKYIIVFLTIISYIWPIVIPLSFASSGEISLYFSDIIAIAVCVYCLFNIVKGKIKNNLTYIISFAFVLIGIMFFLETLLRIYKGFAFYKCFEAVFRTLSPLAFGVIVLEDLFKSKNMLFCVNYAISFVNLYSLILHIVQKSIQNMFFGNANILLFFCLLGMMLNGLFFVYKKNNLLCRCICGFNNIYYIIVFFVTGSRLGVVFGVIEIVFCFGYFYYKKYAKFYLTTLSISILVISLLWMTNLWNARFLMSRGLSFATIKTAISVVVNTETDTETDEEKISDQEVKPNNASDNTVVDEKVMVENDVGRFSMWKKAVVEIQKSPLYGTGVIGVYKTGYGNQTAHNFLLEYALIYGVIGLLVWIAFFCVYFFKVFHINHKRNFIGFVFVLTIIFGFSFFQSTLVSGIGPMIAWITIFIFSLENSKIDMKNDFNEENGV